MVSDEIRAVARKEVMRRMYGGISVTDMPDHDADIVDAALEAVAPLIRAAALEEAAVVAEAAHAQRPMLPPKPTERVIGRYKGEGVATGYIAAAIRALKEQKP